jgi:putative transposase
LAATLTIVSGAVKKWHVDEVVIPSNGGKYCLWLAVDANGDVLGILVQPQRNAKAARRFLPTLIDRIDKSRAVITDKMCSHFKLIRDLAAGTDHRT